MVQASTLHAAAFREVKEDPAAGWQAFVVVALAGLATGTGIGLAGFFRMAGALSLIGLLIGVICSILLWLGWSLGAWLIGTKVLKCRKKSVTLRELLRTTGFAITPGVLGILAFVPVIGWLILTAATLWVFVALAAALKEAIDIGFGRATVTWAAGCVGIILVLIAATLLSVVSSSYFSGDASDGFDGKLNTIVQPYRFSIALWELRSIRLDLAKLVSFSGENGSNDASIVEKFFSNGQRTPSTQDEVEKILENQIKETLAAENVSEFPPLNLQLVQMPYLLVISPRDKIESTREILLDPRLSLQQIKDIEKKADSLNVSSLVVELGGFGAAFPTLVSNNSSLGFTIDAATEEWLHQYLALRPLGFRYLMDLTGIKRNYEVAQINEAVAGTISQEIGAKVRQQYYPGYEEPVYDASDFNRQMREIRLQVDDYLANGQVETAERYMERKREELAGEGYNIRKLNQAYFAWHGTYANEPTSVSPIGAELTQLRAECTSVKQFLGIVSEMTSEQDLKNKLAERN